MNIAAWVRDHEPVVASGIVSAAGLVATMFGLDLSADQRAALGGVAAGVLALAFGARATVWSPTSHEAAVADAMARAAGPSSVGGAGSLPGPAVTGPTEADKPGGAALMATAQGVPVPRASTTDHAEPGGPATRSP